MTTKFKYRLPKLKDRRDTQILCDVFRNELTTLEATHKRWFGELTPDAARKVIDRLGRDKYLVDYPLWNNTPYYRLGPRGIKRCNCSAKRGDAVGPQRLPYLLGCVALTCLGPTTRLRLLPHELVKHVPFFAPTMHGPWAYLWEEEGQRLGTIRVELRLRADRVVKKLCDQLYQYAGMSEEFSELIDSGRFFYCVVMASEEQEFALQEEAEQGLRVPLETSHFGPLERFV
jgi:hypothetical protein